MREEIRKIKRNSTKEENKRNNSNKKLKMLRTNLKLTNKSKMSRSKFKIIKPKSPKNKCKSNQMDKERNQNFGRISLITQYLTRPKFCFSIERKSFSPRPKVESV